MKKIVLKITFQFFFLVSLLSFTAELEALKLITSNLLKEEAYKNGCINKKFKVSFETRVESFKSLLKQEMPDTCCLQECDEPWKKEIETIIQNSELRHYKLIRLNKSVTNLAILINTQTIKQEGPATETTEPRMMIQRFSEISSKQSFFIINIHAHWRCRETDQHLDSYLKKIKFTQAFPTLAVGD